MYIAEEKRNGSHAGFWDLGITEYESCLEWQKQQVILRQKNKITDRLNFTEHWPVYTTGSRKDAMSNILPKHPPIPVVRTSRGGDVTYHGLGQIVGYPIISLLKNRDLHQYLRNLEEVLTRVIQCLGLAAHRRRGKTGIWIEDRKLAAIGVGVKSWISYHGFALNVNLDLNPFGSIIPCGVSPEEGSVSSLRKELESSLDIDEVKELIAVEFWKIFD